MRSTAFDASFIASNRLFLLLSLIPTAIYCFSLLTAHPLMATLIFFLSVFALIYRTLYILITGKNSNSFALIEPDYAHLRTLNLYQYKTWLQRNHFGNSSTKDLVLRRIQNQLLLSQPNPSRNYLGVYLFSGPQHCGKTHFATLLSQALFSEKNPLSLTLQESFFSTENLIQSLKDNPLRVILLTDLDLASPHALQTLDKILKEGFVTSSHEKRNYSIAGCLFVGIQNETSSSERKSLGVDLLFTETFKFNALSILDQTRAFALRLAEYWSANGVHISEISPELLIHFAAALQKNGLESTLKSIPSLSSEAILRTKLSNINKITLHLDEHNQISTKAKQEFQKGLRKAA